MPANVSSPPGALDPAWSCANRVQQEYYNILPTIGQRVIQRCCSLCKQDKGAHEKAHLTVDRHQRKGCVLVASALHMFVSLALKSREKQIHRNSVVGPLWGFISRAGRAEQRLQIVPGPRWRPLSFVLRTRWGRSATRELLDL